MFLRRVLIRFTGVFIFLAFVAGASFLWPASSHEIRIVDVVDVGTAERRPILNAKGNETGYTTDSKSVYFRDRLVPGADALTFRAFTHERVGGKDQYGVDSERVFLFGEVIPEADASTFVVLEEVQSCGIGCSYEAYDRFRKYMQRTIVD